ncbi:MAG: hypothetical protein NUV69_02930 [Candidatus Curtissbacteria bacterium]|nr:hypothetical protein [Candidatus Curtissbacteria bacterium]
MPVEIGGQIGVLFKKAIGREARKTPENPEPLEAVAQDVLHAYQEGTEESWQAAAHNHPQYFPKIRELQLKLEDGENARRHFPAELKPKLTTFSVVKNPKTQQLLADVLIARCAGPVGQVDEQVFSVEEPRQILDTFHIADPRELARLEPRAVVEKVLSGQLPLTVQT